MVGENMEDNEPASAKRGSMLDRYLADKYKKERLQPVVINDTDIEGPQDRLTTVNLDPQLQLQSVLQTEYDDPSVKARDPWKPNIVMDENCITEDQHPDGINSKEFSSTMKSQTTTCFL